MLGRKALDDLRLQKQALILESHLNRLTLQNQLAHLRHAGSWITSPTGAWRKASPWLLAAGAAAAGFLFIRRRPRSSPHSESAFGRILSILKLVQPLYGLWTHLRAQRRPQAPNEAESP
jgi:hypothetical protein